MLKSVCDLDEAQGASFEGLVAGCNKETVDAVKVIYDIVFGAVQEAELRMSQPSKRKAAGNNVQPRTTSQTVFFSPAKAVVSMGQGWPDSDADEDQV